MRYVLEARDRLRITQVQLAALLGVHPITVSKWERLKAKPTPWQQAAIEALASAPGEVPASETENLFLNVPELIATRGAFTAFSILISQTTKKHG